MYLIARAPPEQNLYYLVVNIIKGLIYVHGSRLSYITTEFLEFSYNCKQQTVLLQNLKQGNPVSQVA